MPGSAAKARSSGAIFIRLGRAPTTQTIGAEPGRSFMIKSLKPPVMAWEKNYRGRCRTRKADWMGVFRAAFPD